MRRIHPAGLFEAICPCPDRDGKFTIHAANGRRGRNENHDPRSVCFSATVDRVRYVLAQRGAALAELQPPGRAPSHDRRRGRRQFRRLGPQRHRHEHRRRLQSIGTAAATRCASTSPAASGNCSCRVWAKARFTSTRSATTTKSSRSPTRTVSPPRCRRGPPRRSSISIAITGTTTTGSASASETNWHERPISLLRGPSRKLEAAGRRSDRAG